MCHILPMAQGLGKCIDSSFTLSFNIFAPVLSLFLHTNCVWGSVCGFTDFAYQVHFLEQSLNEAVYLSLHDNAMGGG